MLVSHKLPLYYIFRKIRYELLFTFIISISVYYITHIYKDILPVMPLTLSAFVGTAISILLSFKLNQSYDRWWEARKVWGEIVNDSRTFVIQLQTLQENVNVEMIRKMALRQIAWCYCLGQSLRGLNPLENIDNLISAEEISEIKKNNNKPLKFLQLHAKDLAKLKQSGHLELFSQIQLNNTIVRFTDAMGKAERIKNTVFPITYRYILHMIIYLFLIILSMSLTNTSIYFELAFLLSIGTVFFLLDKTALHLQDPFSNRPTDVSVTAIARTIDINLRQLINEPVVPDPLMPNRFYLM